MSNRLRTKLGLRTKLVSFEKSWTLSTNLTMLNVFYSKFIYIFSSNLFIYYSLCLTFFVMFEKSKFLREHHLLSCLPFKNV